MKITSIIRCSLLFIAVCVVTNLSAQRNPVTWNGTSEKQTDGTYVMNISAEIQSGWYVYSQNLESDMGPVPTSVELEGGEALGDVEESGNRKEGMDKAFDMNVIKYLDHVTFSQKVKVPANSEGVTYTVFYMTCNGEICLPPKSVDVVVAL